MSGIGPDDKVVIMSGTEPISGEAFDAMLAQLILTGAVDDSAPCVGHHDEIWYGGAPNKLKPTNPERDAWNAAVDAKKAEKKARKGLK
jgi:hypothetical protein